MGMSGLRTGAVNSGFAHGAFGCKIRRLRPGCSFPDIALAEGFVHAGDRVPVVRRRVRAGRLRNREWMRGSQGQLRRLLMEWDPIGVSGISEAGDEYGFMIGPLLHRLSEGADARSLADWISHERSSHFGLGPDGAHDMQLAERLTVWREGRRPTTT